MDAERGFESRLGSMQIKSSTGGPHDELTGIADAIIALVPDDVRVVVMVTRDEKGGTGVHGYDESEEGFETLADDVVRHVAALTRHFDT